MLKLEKFFKSPEGVKLFSIMLGLGIAGLFKMSCDSRSCLTYKGPEFKEDKSSLDIQPKRSKPVYPKNTVSLNTTEMSEIDAKLMENLEPMDGGHFRCRICGKDSTGMKGTKHTYHLKNNMKNHVETHLEGLFYSCQLCGKEFRSKNSLAVHKSLKH